jgi:hypothetical protein
MMGLFLYPLWWWGWPQQSRMRGVILVAGVAGLVAGAMSMAAGEYVSVSSQSDTERADIKREEVALRDMPAAELEELVEIYRLRGLTDETARIVAHELSEHDALGAHIRDELGLSEIHSANPLEAAVASGLTFSVAAAIPVLAAVVAPSDWILPMVWLVTVGRFGGTWCAGREVRRGAAEACDGSGDGLGCSGDGGDHWRGASVWRTHLAARVPDTRPSFVGGAFCPIAALRFLL